MTVKFYDDEGWIDLERAPRWPLKLTACTVKRYGGGYRLDAVSKSRLRAEVEREVSANER
jgi:hypothetical protein